MRVFKSAELQAWRFEQDGASALDASISEILHHLGTLHGTQAVLVDFKISRVQTNYVPPRYDEYLTVIADV